MRGTPRRADPTPPVEEPDRRVVDRHFQVGAVTLEYHSEADAEGLRVALAVSTGEEVRATIRVRGPVEVHVERVAAPAQGARRFARWALDLEHVSFQDPGGSHGDYVGREMEVFESLVAMGYRALALAPLADCDAAFEAIDELGRLASEGVRWVVGCCDRSAFLLSRRFHPLVRSHLYQQLVDDGSGRIRQLAAVCPGAIALAAGLHARGGMAREASRQLEGDVVAGRALSRVLRDAVEVLLLAEVGLEERLRRGVTRGDATELLDGPIERIDAWARRTRLFVRRAGPLVSPLDLCAMPPPHFTPEDIPGTPRANAQWYAAMRVAALVAEGRDVPAGTWAFLSRNVVAPRDADDVTAGSSRNAWALRTAGLDLVRDALAQAEVTGRWPTRTTSFERWLSSLRAWRRCRNAIVGPAERLGDVLEKLRHLELGDVEAIEPAAERAGWDHRAGPVFPLLDVSLAHVPGVELRPIRTALELAAEGRRMGHCAAGLCGELVAGERWVLSGTVLGEAVTVEVSRRGAGHEISEARGAGNRVLSDGQWNALRQWASALGPSGRACPSYG